MAIAPDTAVGPVRLAVAEPSGSREFYERAIGLAALEGGEDVVRLGPAGGEPVVELAAEPDAPPRPGGTSGLFHLAILLGDRVELARALQRVIEAGWRLTGASDHLVSEALYLDDPEGNGIELYRDRPRGEWRYVDGALEMATLPLDVRSLAAEVDGADGGAGPDTGIGHVHLNVGDLAAAEYFYNGLLGFDVTVRGYPGALFLSAGGYHHHIGLNTWAGEGAPPPPPGSRGLRAFDVRLPSRDELDTIAQRLEHAGVESRREDGSVLTADPSGNGVRLTAPD